MRNWAVWTGVAAAGFVIVAAQAQQSPSVQQVPTPGQRRQPPPAAGAQTGDKIAQPIATFKGLDKITGLTKPFDVAIDETVQFGALQVTPRVCYSRPATMAAQTTSFVEVDEVTLDDKIKRIFTGWMFADSPGLHAVEHGVYDVWLVDCKASSPDVTVPKRP